MLKGIDVSYYQGHIDWGKVMASGIEFAFIRAGYGRVVDTRFVENIKGAKAVGMPVGVYWFSYALSTSDAVAEANFCHSTIKQYGVDLPVYYDFEYDTERYAGEKGITYSKRSRTAIIDAFCSRIKALGYETGVYVNLDYIKYRLNWTPLKKYPLWLAHFITKDGVVSSFNAASPNDVSKTYGEPTMWQFGATKVSGISGNTDVNYGYFELPKAGTQSAATIKKGDAVKVINTTVSGKRKCGKTYSGGSFVLWYDKYTVISVSGDRVVIGVNGVVTAAVRASDIQKI